MKVLVTGSRGFIGSHLMKDLGMQAIGFDLAISPRQDIKTMWAVHGEQVDVIVHLAASCIVLDSINQPLTYFKNNVLGTVNMLEVARRQDIEQVIYASSAAALNRDTPYGLSKFEGEQWCELYSRLYGFDTCILRLFNVYGPGQNKGVIFNFVNQVKEGIPLTIHGDGKQTRDFIHVADVVRDIRQLIDGGGHGFYQFGTGVETSIMRLALMFSTYRKLRIDKQPARPGDVRRSFASHPYGSKFIELSEGIKGLLSR